MNGIGIKANIVTALYEHDLSPTLESVIDRLGYTDLYDTEFSEEDIVSYVVNTRKKMQHETMIEANKRLAGLHDLEEEILRDIDQGEKTIKYLQTQLRSNKNLTSAEIKHIRKALRKDPRPCTLNKKRYLRVTRGNPV